MSGERSLRVSLYWGGKIYYQDGSVCYFPPASNRTFILRNKIGYEELVDKIYQYMGVDRGMFRLKIFLRQPCGRLSYNVSAVVDDETLDVMYSLWDEIVPYTAELYIDREEIAHIPPVYNVGPMMSLVHTCMDPTQLHPASNTIVTKMPSAAQHPPGGISKELPGSWIRSGHMGECGIKNMLTRNIPNPHLHGLDSISSFSDSTSPYQLSPHAYESIPGPSHPRPDEVDVYTGRHDTIHASTSVQDPEIDIEDLEESDSEDVSVSDSDNENEVCDFQQNIEPQTDFEDDSAPYNQQHNTTQQHIGEALSYVPRGLAYFTDLGNITDGASTDEDDSTSIPIYNEDNRNIRLHMRFESKQQLVRAIRMWSINQNREFKVVESKRDTWVAKCKSSFDGTSTTECDWSVRALRKKTHKLWQISRWVSDHACLGTLSGNNSTSLTSSVIARHIVRSVKDDPEFKVKNIISAIKKDWKIDITYKKAWYARQKVIELVSKTEKLC